MSKKTSKKEETTATSEETAIATSTGNAMIAGFSGEFSDQEVFDASNASLSYFKLFGKFLRADLNNLVLCDASDGSDIKKIEQPLKCSVLYYHSVFKLFAGHLNGAQGSLKDWSDDDKELKAVTYGKHVRSGLSAGSFYPHFMSYLENAEQRKELSKRCYAFLVSPEFEQDGPVIATFGPSAMQSLSAMDQTAMRMKIPKGLLQAELSLVQDENEDGESYFRPTFKFVTSEDGKSYLPAFENKADYDASHGKMLNEILDLHETQIKASEQIKTDEQPQSEGEPTGKEDDIPF